MMRSFADISLHFAGIHSAFAGISLHSAGIHSNSADIPLHSAGITIYQMDSPHHMGIPFNSLYIYQLSHCFYNSLSV